MNKKELVINYLNSHNGYITTSELVNLGISKSLIPNYIKSKTLKKVGYGLYMDYSKLEDKYYIIQKRYPNAIFSYNTAFYILNLINTIRKEVDVTIERKQRVREKYNVHYVSENYYNVGIIEIASPSGNLIKVYNAERCICDMLKSDAEFNLELQNKILDCYFKSKDKDIDRLLEYSKLFNIHDKVDTIVKLMMK